MCVQVGINHLGNLTVSHSDVKPKPIVVILFPLPAFGLGMACVISPGNGMWGWCGRVF